MIQTTQTVAVAAPIDETWTFAKDVERWAEIMPGYQQCDLRDADHSTWVLKVGVGAMVRTVTVDVHVTRWAGPEAVDFDFALKGDPVTGSGTYRAEAANKSETSVTLAVRVCGGGPMAPMWEAMGGPLLPKFARGLAEDLKARIEAQRGEPSATAIDRPSRWQRLVEWLKRLLR